MRRRWPGSSWGWPLAIVAVVWLICELWRPAVKQAGGEVLAWMAFGLSLGALYLVRSHDWVPPVVGAAFGGYFWALGKSRKRPIPIAVAGCFAGSAATLLVRWPSEQRSLPALICAGIAVALQGGWKTICRVRGQPAEKTPIAR